ncbi:MAG: hypothetical protein WCS20_08365 [Alphaproteobacteria bacterium]|jgi:hypothetical protein
MTVVLGLSVFGGLRGSSLLLMHIKLAMPVLSVSLAGYFSCLCATFVLACSPTFPLNCTFWSLLLPWCSRCCGSRDVSMPVAEPIAPDSASQPTNLNRLKQETTMQYMMMLNENAEDYAKRNDPQQSGTYWCAGMPLSVPWRRPAS